MIARRSVLAGLPAVGLALAVPASAAADVRPAAERIASHQRELRRALREERGGHWIVCGVNRSGPGAQWFGVPPGWGLKNDGKPVEEQS